MSPVTPQCCCAQSLATTIVLLYGKRAGEWPESPGMLEKQKYIQKQEASSVPGQGPGSIVVLLLGFCMPCVSDFCRNKTIPAINNGLMLSFIWALNLYYIYAFVPYFAQFLYVAAAALGFGAQQSVKEINNLLWHDTPTLLFNLSYTRKIIIKSFRVNP